MERETFLLTMTAEKAIVFNSWAFPFVRCPLLQSCKKNTELFGHSLEGPSWGYAENHLLFGAKEL